MQKLLLAFENILFYLLVAVAVFIPLYPKIPLFAVSGTFVAIRVEDILITSSLFLWIVYLTLSKKLTHLFSNLLNQSLLTFFFIGALSLISGLLITKTISLNLGILHYLRRVEFMMLLPFATSVLRTKRQLIIVLSSLSAVVLLVNLYALGQRYLDWPVISTTNSEFSKGLILYLREGARVNSTFAGHYDLAIFLAMVLSMLSALFFLFKSIKLKVYTTILTGLSFLILVMTAARLSFIAAALGICSSLILLGKKKLIFIFFLLALLALVYPSQLRDRFISTIKINIQQEGERYEGATEAQRRRSELNIPTLATLSKPSRNATGAFEATEEGVAADITPGEPLDTTQLGVYRSFSIRLNQEWPAALRAFIKNPLLGSGYSSLGLATDNDFLRSLGEIGLLGTISFTLIILLIFKMVLKNFRSPDEFLKFFSVGTISMIVAFLINSLFIDVFEASKVASLFWLMIGINLASSNTYKS